MLLLCLSGAQLFAGIKHRPYALELELSGVQPALNDSAQVWAFRPSYGVGFQYMISPQTGFELKVRQTNIYNDTTAASLLKYDRQNASQLWEIKSFALGPKFYLGRREKTTAFVATRMQVMFWRVISLPSKEVVEVTNKSDGPTDFTATELGFTAGLGIEHIFWERLGLTTSFNFTWLSGMGADFSDEVNSFRSRALIEFSTQVALNFGTPRRSLRERYREEMARRDEHSVRTVYEGVVDDSTGDTVFVDQSKGADYKFVPVFTDEIVPEEDYDLDGIRNQFDLCPDTPRGALVDKNGCPHDEDGDGVFDGLDDCPETPLAAANSVDQQGCPADADYDGIPNYLDQCPNSPPAAKVDSSGCTPDADGDGVIDAHDFCLDTPPNVAVDQNGCPKLEEIFAKRIITSLFVPGTAVVDTTEAVVLDSIANYLVWFPQVSAVVYGYTDNIGPDDANLLLSQKRARAVLRYLTGRGVSESRLQAVGLGETNFIASNRKRAGREANRRVEVEFSFPDSN